MYRLHNLPTYRQIWHSIRVRMPIESLIEAPAVIFFYYTVIFPIVICKRIMSTLDLMFMVLKLLDKGNAYWC